MSLRVQILLATMALAAVPLLVAIVVVGAGFEDEFTARDTRRVEDRLQHVLEGIESQDRHLVQQLDALAAAITGDNRFRLAALADSPDVQTYLRDYAPRRLDLMDLDMLQIQDPQGVVVSSGHFPGAHGALQPRLATLVARTPDGRALMSVREPAGSFLALVRVRALELAGTTWQLVGGRRLDRQGLESLAGDPDLRVLLAWPGGEHGDLAEERAVLVHEQRLRRAGQIVRTRHLPLVQDDNLTDAWVVISHDRGSLRLLLAEIRRRLGLLLAVVAVLAVPLALALATGVSRPLRRLAQRTGDLDLDRLDADFASSRRDEVGQLSRVLADLTDRLRRGVAELRAAEHRATLGEVARQVNHDIRNGITPLRNVLRHLGEVAAREPQQLAGVFEERRGNLDTGLEYLEELAGHYARLSPGRAAQPCHLEKLVPALLSQTAIPQGARVNWDGAADLAPVMADPVSLRRILENLVRNAVEALPATGGLVTVRAAADPDETGMVLIEVADNGAGIPEEDRDRIFHDFFTTKDTGTGLGLSNVRRLVGDLGGAIRVSSEVGRGTVFVVELPMAEGT